ncbi:MAG: Flp family type IVb pilin [Geminicoccaceae bacterium]|nr:Flp family type IVb pilin [Geminicoccaceae bacterium]
MSTKFTRRKLFGLRTGDTEGGTAIEYGLIAALIALVLVGVLELIGDRQAQSYRKIKKELQKSVRDGRSP